MLLLMWLTFYNLLFRLSPKHRPCLYKHTPPPILIWFYRTYYIAQFYFWVKIYCTLLNLPFKANKGLYVVEQKSYQRKGNARMQSGCPTRPKIADNRRGKMQGG